MLTEKPKLNLKSILNNLPGMVYRCKNDKNWTMEYLSKGAQKLTGYSVNDILKNKKISYELLIYPADRKIVRETVNNAINDKKAFELEYRIIHKSGIVKWVLEQGQFLSDSKSKSGNLEGFIMDVTERKKSEEELNQKWLDYKGLVDHLPVGVLLHSDGKIIFANNEAVKIGGVKRVSDLYGKMIFEFLKPSDVSIAKERAEKAKQKVELKKQYYEITNFKGGKLSILANSSYVIYKGKEVVQISIQDITNEKKLEEEKNLSKSLKNQIKLQEQTQRKLIQTQQSLRQIIDSSLDVISAADASGNITEFNFAAEKIFGYKKEEVIGKKASILFKNNKAAADLIKNKLLKTGFYQGNVTNVKKNGEVFTSFLSAAVLKDQSGKILGTMGVSRDITDAFMQQEKLMESEEKYRAIFNQAFIGIARVDAKNFSFIDVNNHLCKLLGYTKEEFVQKKLFELFVNPDKSILKNYFNGNYNENRLITRTNCIDKFGNEIEMNLSFSFVNEAKNRQKKYSIIAFEDVSQFVFQEEKLKRQTAKLTSVFENSSHLVWTLNNKRELTYFNSNYAKTLTEEYGICPKQNVVYTDLINKKYISDYIQKWEIKFHEVFSGEKFFLEREEIKPDGSVLIREIYLNPIKDEQGRVIEMSYFAQDITARRKSEKQIVEQSSRLKAIFESGNLLIWSMNTNRELTSFNKNYSQAIKELYGALPKAGEKIKSTSNKSHRALWEDKYKQVLNGKSVEFSTERKSINGSTSIARFHLHPLITDEKIVGIAGIGQDITEQRQAEKSAFTSEAKNKAILEAIPDLIFSLSSAGKFISVKTPEGSGKYEEEKYIGKSITAVFPGQLGKILFQKIKVALSEKSVVNHEYETEKKDGKKFFEMRLSAINANECMAILRDITESKISEQKILNSLKEKEILLKEVHHRVKNNLQVISSILNLQSNFIRDKNTVLILKECQNRIKSMAFIHELLYQSKDFSRINFSDYLIALSKNLIQSYNTVDQKIKYKFEIETVYFTLDTSISCGLIANELLTNALKYAFPGKKEGYIFISLKKTEKGTELIIKDNGIGLPAGLDYRNTETLGLQLVNALVEQVSGELRFIPGKGSSFSIVIKTEQ